MRVVLAAKSVYPFHPFGGVQKYVYYFAKHLKEKGVDVEIVAPLDRGKPRTEYFEGLRYTLLYPSISSFLELPIGWLGVHVFAYRLAHYLKSQSFDLLHSFDMTGFQYLKISKRKPVIAHIFSDNFFCNPISIGKYLSLFGFKPRDIKEQKVSISPFASWETIITYPAQYFFKVLPMYHYLAKAERTLLEAEDFRKDVIGLFRLDAAKVQILPVGVQTELPVSAGGRNALTRESLGIKAEDLVLLTVNRLAADKGVDKIILALDKLVRKSSGSHTQISHTGLGTGSPIKLVIVGKGYEKESLLALIKEKKLSEHVRMVEDVEEEFLSDYYNIADIYVCAFSYKGSSVSVLEAMAAGLPIVTTAQPWLVDNQRNGIFLFDNQPETLAEAVQTLIQGDYKAKGKFSLDIVRHYDWSKIAGVALDVYQKVAFKANNRL